MKEKSNPHYDVREEELHTFKPVALAVGDDEIDHNDREYDGDELEGVEDEVHRLAEGNTGKHQDRSDEHRYLSRRADRDLERKIHPVFERNRDCGDVFCGIPDDRNENHADKKLRPSQGGDERCNRANQNITDPDN